MKTLAILSLLLASTVQAQTYTWCFIGQRHTSAIPQEEFEKGVRDGFAMFRYFNRNFREVPGPQANVRVVVKHSHPWGRNYDWLFRSAWFVPGMISIGKDMPGDADSVRRTIMHELTHLVSHPTNWHRWQSYVNGHRFGDIGSPNATWTPYDVRIMAYYGWRRVPDKPEPWDDVHWWAEQPPRIYPWTNPRDKYDVDDDGQVTNRDAELIVQAIRDHIVRVDTSREPEHFYDVTGNGKITSLDALQVINEIKRRNK